MWQIIWAVLVLFALWSIGDRLEDIRNDYRTVNHLKK